MKTWKSSVQTFKDAVSLAFDAWEPILVLIALQVVVGFLADVYLVAVFSDGLDVYSAPGIVAWTAVILVYWLFQTFWSIALVRIVGGKSSLREIFGAGLWRKIPQILLLGILLALGVGIASIFLVVPGVILSVWWMPALFILVLEDTKAIDALRRSYRLVKGWSWPVFSRITFVFLIIALLTFFTIIPEAGIRFYSFISLFISPVIVLFLGLTYKELREAKASRPAADWPTGKKVLVTIWGIFVLLLLSLFTALGDFVAEVASLAS